MRIITNGKNVNKKVITNADYIRSMSDEQLANWTSEAWNHTDYEEDDYDPYILAWLKTKRIEK